MCRERDWCPEKSESKSKRERAVTERKRESERDMYMFT